MKAVVFSDSHGDTAAMREALEREAPDQILHLGDLAGAATLAKELDAQMRALSEMLAHAGAQPREAEHVAQ